MAIILRLCNPVALVTSNTVLFFYIRRSLCNLVGRVPRDVVYLFCFSVSANLFGRVASPDAVLSTLRPNKLVGLVASEMVFFPPLLPYRPRCVDGGFFSGRVRRSKLCCAVWKVVKGACCRSGECGYWKEDFPKIALLHWRPSAVLCRLQLVGRVVLWSKKDKGVVSLGCFVIFDEN